MQIRPVIHEILANKDFTVTDDLISWLFVATFVHPCYDLKLELRLHLGKGLRKDKGIVELVKCKDTGMYLCYIYY